MKTVDYAASFDGTLIHYVANKGRGPTLVFMHGAGSNATAWNPILERFKGQSYIAMDLRNHGLSGFGKCSFERMVRDVIAVLSRENIDEFIPVGMSIGAQFAVELADRFPKRVKKIVLISPSSKSLIFASERWMDVMRFIRKTVSLFPRRRSLRLMRDGHNIPALLSPFWELFGIHIRDYAFAVERSLERELMIERVTQPTLLLTGTKDILINKMELRRISKRTHVTHKEIKSHHLIPARAPQKTAELIAHFIEAK